MVGKGAKQEKKKRVMPPVVHAPNNLIISYNNIKPFIYWYDFQGIYSMHDTTGLFLCVDVDLESFTDCSGPYAQLPIILEWDIFVQFPIGGGNPLLSLDGVLYTVRVLSRASKNSNYYVCYLANALWCLNT